MIKMNNYEGKREDLSNSLIAAFGKFFDGLELTGEDASKFFHGIAEEFGCSYDEAILIFVKDMEEIGAKVKLG